MSSVRRQNRTISVFWPFWNEKRKFAIAENRIRVSCLEGSYACPYTTIACHRYALIIDVLKRCFVILVEIVFRDVIKFTTGDLWALPTNVICLVLTWTKNINKTIFKKWIYRKTNMGYYLTVHTPVLVIWKSFAAQIEKWGLQQNNLKFE